MESAGVSEVGVEMGMMGIIRLWRLGVRDGWKVMLDKSMAARDERVAVWFCS